MAISQFVEPDVDLFFDDLTQVMRLNNKASFYGKGYINIWLSNINSAGTPLLLQGSTFECGGVLFAGDSDTSITGTPSNGLNYIYFNPSTKGLSYSTTTPKYNVVQGGWYNGDNRAIALFYFYSNEYRGKRVIGGPTDDLMPLDIGDVTSGGTSVSIPGYVANTKNTYTVTLPRGWYRAVLTSGLGGGDGGNAIEIIAGVGGVASVRDTKTGTFFWWGGSINVKIGGDGSPGGNGGYGAISGDGYNGAGGGGGSGKGEASEITGVISVKSIKAGKGGNGSDGTSNGVGGGGGGGSPGGAGGMGNQYKGQGGELCGGSAAGYCSGGGAYGGGVGTSSIYGGSGGGQGLNGEDQADGAPGGSCSIWRL